MALFEGGFSNIFGGNENNQKPKKENVINRAGGEDPELPAEEHEKVDIEEEKERIRARIIELKQILASDPNDADSSDELSGLEEKLYNLENPIGQDY